jgi:hypothetical protein
MWTRNRRIQIASALMSSAAALTLVQPTEASAATAMNCNSVCLYSCPNDLQVACATLGCPSDYAVCYLDAPGCDGGQIFLGNYRLQCNAI